MRGGVLLNPGHFALDGGRDETRRRQRDPGLLDRRFAGRDGQDAAAGECGRSLHLQAAFCPRARAPAPPALKPTTPLPVPRLAPNTPLPVLVPRTASPPLTCSPHTAPSLALLVTPCTPVRELVTDEAVLPACPQTPSLSTLRPVTPIPPRHAPSTPRPPPMSLTNRPP